MSARRCRRIISPAKRRSSALLLRPREFWDKRNVALLLGTRIVAVDPGGADASPPRMATPRLRRSRLGRWRVAAAASRARRGLPGVHTVRTRADVDALRAELRDRWPGRRYRRRLYRARGGGGARQARQARSSLLEALDRVLARVAGEAAVALLRGRASRARRRGPARRSRSTGSRRRTAASPASPRRRRASAVRRCVIVGIGIVPSVAPLIAAGASGANGVDVDEFCRTSLPACLCDRRLRGARESLCRAARASASNRCRTPTTRRRPRSAPSSAIRSPIPRRPGSGRTSMT